MLMRRAYRNKLTEVEKDYSVKKTTNKKNRAWSEGQWSRRSWLPRNVYWHLSL